MKSYSLVLSLCALSFCACGGADESGDAAAGAWGTLQAQPQSERFETFETDDASYQLGEHLDAQGELVNVEVIYDASSSYLTPQTPASTWIMDGALAHTQQGALLLNQVVALGLYVRDCATGQWVNAGSTPFAAQSDLLQSVYGGKYTLGHFYGNIRTNVLLSGQFDCQTDPPSFSTVTIDGKEQDVQRVGDVEFAYVVEHRQ